MSIINEEKITTGSPFYKLLRAGASFMVNKARQSEIYVMTMSWQMMIDLKHHQP